MDNLEGELRGLKSQPLTSSQDLLAQPVRLFKSREEGRQEATIRMLGFFASEGVHFPEGLEKRFPPNWGNLKSDLYIDVLLRMAMRTHLCKDITDFFEETFAFNGFRGRREFFIQGFQEFSLTPGEFGRSLNDHLD